MLYPSQNVVKFFCWWVLQHRTGFARLVWGRLRVHRAFIYSNWFVCSVCFCSLLPRLTLLLSFLDIFTLYPLQNVVKFFVKCSQILCLSCDKLILTKKLLDLQSGGRMRWIFRTLQQTATPCNTLQHSATLCNTLQHTSAHCNTLQQIATHCITLLHSAALRNTLQ